MMAMEAPCLPNWDEISNPIPDPPPVINATFPFRISGLNGDGDGDDAMEFDSLRLDQLGDVLHWIRQAVALVCGLLWGAIPLVGGVWLFVFLAISTAVVYGYYAIILKIDEEEFGGHGALLQEGLFASATLFLLAWILVYSLVHF